MKLHFSLLPILAFLFVGLLVASHAALTPEEYWKKLLPNTPMPKAIQDSLQTETISEEDTSVSVGSDGVDVSAGKPGNGAHVNVGSGGVDVHAGKPGNKGADVHVGNNGVDVNAGKPGNKGATNVHVGSGVDVSAGKPSKGADVHVGSGGVDVNAGGHGKGGASVHVGNGGVSVHAGGKGKHVTVKVPGQSDPFLYNYAASETQLHDNPNVALFFVEKDLRPGTQMNLHFTKTTNDATFLPRDVAESIPFSSDRIPEILARFDVAPGSKEAQVLRDAIRKCEEKGIVRGEEERYCATSLEAMVDFTVSKLGNKEVTAVISTHAEKRESTPMQKYVFTGVKAMPASTDSVVCHKQNYAYAMFYCHKTRATKTYVVSLVGTDGDKVKAAVVCHTDTSKWNPKHLAFQVLKVEPGSVPICHFLPEDHIVWVRT